MTNVKSSQVGRSEGQIKPSEDYQTALGGELPSSVSSPSTHLQELQDRLQSHLRAETAYLKRSKALGIALSTIYALSRHDAMRASDVDGISEETLVTLGEALESTYSKYSSHGGIANLDGQMVASDLAQCIITSAKSSLPSTQTAGARDRITRVLTMFIPTHGFVDRLPFFRAALARGDPPGDEEECGHHMSSDADGNMSAGDSFDEDN